MSGAPDNPVPNGADTAPRSLREIAEESWDQVIDEAGPEEDDGPEPEDTGPYARDEHGRFVSKETSPGEQTEVPAPEEAPPAQQPTQPPPGSSSEAPQHWSAEDKATFARLPQEGRDFLLRRHGEMERDYQGKVQASASAVNFVQSLNPIFADPLIQKSLADVGAHPVHAIEQWAGFHRRAIDPNPQVRATLWRELGQKMELDPAAVFGPQTVSPPGNLPPEVQQNPVFRYLTDQISSAVNANQALRADLQTMVSQGERQRQDDMLHNIRQSIDQFADETDAQGRPLRPHFDKVGNELAILIHHDPNIDMRYAYDMACRMNPEVWQLMQNAGQANQQQQASLQRAQAAARSNVRGRTTPVSRPDPDDDGRPRGLMHALAAAAEEVGYEG